MCVERMCATVCDANMHLLCVFLCVRVCARLMVVLAFALLSFAVVCDFVCSRMGKTHDTHTELY